MKQTTPWCNGSTTGFGPVSLGSNPGGVAIFFALMAKKITKPHGFSSPFRMNNFTQKSQTFLHFFTKPQLHLPTKKAATPYIQKKTPTSCFQLHGCASETL